MSTTLASEEFRDVIGRFASGVTVVTTTDDGRALGTTASAVSSLSLEPPMLLACLNRTSETGQAIGRAGVYGVSVLAEDCHDLAARFARKGDDKFDGVEVEAGHLGVPLLTRALATVECRVVERATGGTHVVFLAEVEHATGRAGRPLLYFRGAFGRLLT
jgi:flavin reductase (DIM6/NTAB) family NADH-FMN oxidoreductase RutF